MIDLLILLRAFTVGKSTITKVEGVAEQANRLHRDG